MSDDGALDAPHELSKDERFMQLFGVSQDDVRRRGIDPGVYAREHIHHAMKDRKKWPGIIPESNQYAILWTRWGFRGFVAMFIGLGFLFLSHISAIHWEALGAADLDIIAVLACYVLMLRYRHEYVRACRHEGIVPSWKRRSTASR